MKKMTDDPPSHQRVVIVGAGIAGAAAAAELCRARPDAAVTLVSREPRVKVRVWWACVRWRESGTERGAAEERGH
jgi:glycine/D-amino acid oxidase-like deaminating enzyme